MSKKVTFAALVKRVGDLPMTVMASHESPAPGSSITVAEPSSRAIDAAQMLGGSFPGATGRVLRIAGNLDRLMRLTQPSTSSTCGQCGLQVVGHNG